MKAKVTVAQLIESLQKYPADAAVEIAVCQVNKVYPVAYLPPSESSMVKGNFATMRNGQDVRIEVNLPSDEASFMCVSTRKK